MGNEPSCPHCGCLLDNVTTLPESDRPLSEQYRIVARAWADADSAASLLEELKGATLEQRKASVMSESGKPMPENRAERLVKSSPEWERYIREMCSARSKAGKLRAQLEYFRMRHSEWMAADANARAEMRLGR